VTLLDEELRLHGRIMPASNATFVGEIGDVRVVYKPVAGERPLWDFPDGTLANREVAAYVVSETLGWDVVPHTFLREGPHGLGMVQLWQEPDEQQAAVTVVAEGAVPAGFCHVFDGVDELDQPISLVHENSAALRRITVFDVLVNNADRKGGHVLGMADGHRYGVDHGVTFHPDHKLRTVLWGWAGEPLDDQERAGVERLLVAWPDGLEDKLSHLLDEPELTRLRRRAKRLLASGRFPQPRGDWPAIPWPPF